MEVVFTPEQEARIVKAAHDAGTDVQQLVREAALQFADDADFRAHVLEAQRFAERGEFIEEEEMDRRFEEMLRA